MLPNAQHGINTPKNRSIKRLADAYGGHVPKAPTSLNDHVQRLGNFYCFYNKQRLPQVVSIVKKVTDTGKSKFIMDIACKKYMVCLAPYLAYGHTRCFPFSALSVERLRLTAAKLFDFKIHPQGSEPVLLTEIPRNGVQDLKNSHWFWGPILSGRGPPAYIADEELDATVKEHPLNSSSPAREYVFTLLPPYLPPYLRT